jgi:hypothetical protein
VALIILVFGGLGVWLFLAGLYGVTPAELLRGGGQAADAGRGAGNVHQ